LGKGSEVDRLWGPQVVGKGRNICGQGSARWVLVGCLPGAVDGCSRCVGAVGVGGSRCIFGVGPGRCGERKEVGFGVGVVVEQTGFHGLGQRVMLKSVCSSGRSGFGRGREFVAGIVVGGRLGFECRRKVAGGGAAIC